MLVLVVGPSGVGKDTLLDGGRAYFGDRTDFVFPRREITRRTDAGGEDHIQVDDVLFAQRQAGGHYALSWLANNHAYGIPAAFEEDLKIGRTVVINVSRSVLDVARERFGPVTIVSVRADRTVLERNLSARHRESEPEIQQRLERALAFEVAGPDVVDLWNNGAKDEGIAAFNLILAKFS